MKRHLKGILAMALAFCTLFGICAVGSTAADQNDKVTVYGMTVNDLTDPIGIDSETPTFSWKLQSNEIGQKQTAYRLTVAADEGLNRIVWDSGKAYSNDTTDIPYGGSALADCTRYYWQVTVWDVKGEVFKSAIRFFETAYITGTPLGDAQWIEVGAPTVGETAADSSYTVNYTIEMDVKSIATAIGVAFGQNDVIGETLMWQIKDTGSGFAVVPHIRIDKSWKWGSISGVSNDSFATTAVEYAKLKSEGFKLKIHVTNKNIATYVNGNQVSNVTATGINSPELGILRLRSGTNEGGVIDNLKLTDYASHSFGDLLVDYDFSYIPPLESSIAQGWISNGTLTIPGDADQTLLSNLVTSSLRYTVDVDVVDITDCIGILLSPRSNSMTNMLLWQIADKGSYYQLRPHYYSSGWKAFGAVDFAKGDGEYASFEDGFHITMEVTNNRIKTYVNGKLISNQYKSAFNGIVPTINFVSFCTLYTEKGGVMDNLKITDYSYLKEGQIIRYYDFEDPSLFASGATYALQSGSTVANGVYTSNKISGNIEWFGKVQLKQTPAVEVKPTKVHYAFEADLSCSAVAASMLFSMTDSKNALMWQIVRTASAVKLRPHKIANGKFTAYSDIDITSLVSPDELSRGVKVKIEVADNVINTYVDGAIVSSFETSQLGTDVFLGKFGTRVATNEIFAFDSLKAVNYINNADGEVLFDYDLNTFNPFFRGTLKDGKISFDAGVQKTEGIHIIHAGTDTFRKEFKTAKEIASARLYITSYGVFNAYLNGQRVGNKNADGETVYDELAPGWTDQNYRSCYYTYDITDYLASSTNTLAVGVNHGWKSVSGERSNDPSTPFKLLAQMVITYTDGTSDTVVTDGSWSTAHVGPVMLGELYQGEYYDATADLSFRENGFDDSTWKKAKTVTFNTKLAARDGGAIYVRKDLERAPQTVTVYDGATDSSDTQYGKIKVIATYGDEGFTLKAGQTAVVDFGQNFAGWENITISGEKGTLLRIRHAEMLNDNMGLISRGNDGPEGSIYTASLRSAPASTHYVLSGEGEENYRPTTTYYGFRYIELTATKDITVLTLRGEVATSVTEDTGSFMTSDADINRLWQNVIWGQYSNYFGQATDCPQRDERLGYSGDAQVFAGTAVYNSQVKAFLRNFMQTLVEGQADDGAYGSTLPLKISSGNTWAGVAGWADAGIIVPYDYYKQYGDPSILAEYYDSMAKYMDYLNSMDKRIGLRFGDWLSYAANDTQMYEYISYVYTIWDTQMMQEIAETLGKTDDLAKWATMEQKYLDIARPLYLDANGDHVMTQQTALLFALKVGLYKDEAAYERGKAALVSAIENNGNKLNTGFLGTSILMETLVEIGEADLAYELLFQDGNPSWLYSVKQGATTTWERWNSYSVENGFGAVSMNSFNHYAYGCVGEFMYNTVLGINPDGEGYDKILLTPITTDKITYAKGSYDSVNGLIKSEWRLVDNDRYTYGFTVPMNTTATVRLEKQDGIYFVNGTSAKDATLAEDGAAFLKEEDGYLYFEVTSGNFAFTCEALSGDLNADGTVDGKDAALLRKMIIGSEKIISAADVNGDRKTDVCDLVALKNKI